MAARRTPGQSVAPLAAIVTLRGELTSPRIARLNVRFHPTRARSAVAYDTYAEHG
jgi:hypothetical protein